MSDRLRNRIAVGVIVSMVAALVLLVVSNPSEADRVVDIGSRVRCPVCEGQPIADSPVQMARDMMSLVEERVSQGASDQEIIDELVASYSGALLLDPPASGVTLVLWIAPLAALAIGVAVVVWWRSHPGPEPPRDAAKSGRSRRRALVGGLILAGALGGAVVIAGFFLQEREGPLVGIAGQGTQDLSEVSNETMEAVIAANLTDPQIDGMRLALAERYFEDGEYRAAFPHYLAVAESPSSSDTEAVTALIRLGWMAWEGNREAETAIGLFDEAISIDGESPTALYLKGQVLWCGMDSGDEAARLFALVLSSDRLPEGAYPAVQADLDAASRGEACR